MPAIMGLHHTALSVTDLDRSAQWYCDVLGAEVVFRDDGETRRAAVLKWPSTRPVLGLVEHVGQEHGAFNPPSVGLDALAFTVQTREDLEGWQARLAERGVEHSTTEIPPGAILNFKDPDGIALVLFWDRDPNV